MKVALLQCQEYDLALLKEKIRESLFLIDAYDKIKPNAKVFIKLNLVGPFHPDLGITTHPTFVKAVIQIIKEKTKDILIGDNPATKDLTFTLKKTGIYDVIKEENVRIINNKELITINNSNYKIYDTFEVSKEMIDVDVMINLPKLKTHAFAYMTGAEKNLFGLIYGLSKAGWHVKAANPLQFGEAINDLYGAVLEHFQGRELIHICDGILGLEGEGPGTSGIPKKANAILASYDAISLDRVACELVQLNYERQFINVIGNERKLGVGDLDKIEIVGDKLSDFNIKFLAPKDSLGILGLKIVKIKGFRNLILEHPKIDRHKCIKCGECAHICPPKAMQFKPHQYPHVKTTVCIRCWCCSEVCPQEAISKSKRPLIGRIILKNKN
jgi:uncharacterized protein (DUF362 family)/Pyruvate/2-oxoacid:ferredoxin oxidoreductase delta subunit